MLSLLYSSAADSCKLTANNTGLVTRYGMCVKCSSKLIIAQVKDANVGKDNMQGMNLIKVNKILQMAVNKPCTASHKTNYNSAN